ncbi:hypothetical protein PTT_17156 [Pyrenophora teres f. teres 0-1]|uniref:Uncharacterized protein n=1 Tax=Pyrenophora teres f. teres (strain 0-1) TaxID=861557 RepID=E3S3S2_PYRTT|nr:hypothetical protein PTT_17156 [Pyrenophora teres f. teres 0-1]
MAKLKFDTDPKQERITSFITRTSKSSTLELDIPVSDAPKYTQPTKQDSQLHSDQPKKEGKDMSHTPELSPSRTPTWEEPVKQKELSHISPPRREPQSVPPVILSKNTAENKRLYAEYLDMFSSSDADETESNQICNLDYEVLLHC